MLGIKIIAPLALSDCEPDSSYNSVGTFSLLIFLLPMPLLGTQSSIYQPRTSFHRWDDLHGPREGGALLGGMCTKAWAGGAPAVPNASTDFSQSMIRRMYGPNGPPPLRTPAREIGIF